ncbi:MAG: PAS domain-containing protein [Deltaproteobacteria bacterium]|nr:PAS domain-containing protein [Deltaproteobacteria bacterium]
MSERPDSPSKTAPASGAVRKVAPLPTRRVSATDWATSEHLRTLVDNSQTCIYVKDAAGRYLLMNRRYEDIFHVSSADFLGRTDDDIFPPDVARTLRDNDVEVMRRNEPIEFEEVVPQDDGSHTYVSVKMPLRDEHGRAEGVCGISTDITQRRETERQLRRLTQQLVTVREEERQRLSFRIHDEICQELTGITFMLEATARRIGPERADDLAELTRAQRQLAHVIDHLRAVARGLHPVVLRDLGLAASLRTLAQTMSTPRLTVDTAIAPTLPPLGANVALALYRIAQEAVLNAIRHADTHAIRVSVQPAADEVVLIVADDGLGFDPGTVGTRSLGLLGMEQRATAVGGRLAIESAPGRGTRIVFSCRAGGDAEGS